MALKYSKNLKSVLVYFTELSDVKTAVKNVSTKLMILPLALLVFVPLLEPVIQFVGSRKSLKLTNISARDKSEC